MHIIPEKPNPSGAYPPPQTWDSPNIPEGYAAIPDGFDMASFYAHNGFVTLDVKNRNVTGMTPNTAAWEVWKEENPPSSEPGGYTETQLLGQQLTDEELARIEMGQQITDLEIMILGGMSNV